MGTPLISGRSQWPFDTMSRAIIGNLASSFVASTRAPRSKPRSAALTASTTATGAHPASDGNPEPLLSSPDDRRRQDSLERALQDVLRRPSAKLQLAGNRRGKLDERRVEEGSTHFEAGGHAGSIHGDQGLVGEVEPG